MASFDGERKSGLSKSDHITVTKLTSFLGTIRFCDFAAFLSHRMAWQNQEGEGGQKVLSRISSLGRMEIGRGIKSLCSNFDGMAP